MGRLLLPLTAIFLGLLLNGCGRDGTAAAGTKAEATPTAADQSETADDLALTRRIRQSLMADSSLSLAAKNVAVITIHGAVTLRGRVDTVREKAEIGVRAREIAGVAAVENTIEVIAVQAGKK